MRGERLCRRGVGRVPGWMLGLALALLALTSGPDRVRAQAPVPFNGIQAIVNDTVISRDQVLGAAQRELVAAGRTATASNGLRARQKPYLGSRSRLASSPYVLKISSP